MAHPTQPDLFEFATQDYHRIPASAKQVIYAKRLATERNLSLPESVLEDRRAISEWISSHRPTPAANLARFSSYPSSKQVAFAERIARIKRRDVPRECFQDRSLMSRWIDCNK